MGITLTDQDMVNILMKNHIKANIALFRDHIKKRVPLTTTGALFTRNKDKEHEILSKDKVGCFRHIVEKLLYVSKRARLDVCATIDFSTTRVSKSA